MLLVSGTVWAEEVNQIVEPQFKNASVHDPSIIKVEDTYYVFGSHLAVAKSTDLMNWDIVASGVMPENPLFSDVTEELKEAFTWADATTLWAADVIQLEDGKFYMYYNACEGSSPRSALGVAVADEIEGPYSDLGIFLKSGMWNETSPDGQIYDATKHPNTIDPDAFFDTEGRLWMVYGSYSGGIFILEMDPKTGFPYPDQGYGTKLMGGNHSRIEAPYIQYVPETGYYYLYTTFGGLDSAGGYNIRVARSENPDGPYVDAEGNDMVDAHGPTGSFFNDVAISPYGVKLMGNYQFEWGIGEAGFQTGYVSPGHNSVYYDEETGQQFLIFHTRFPNRGEQHEIRVHQMFMNTDGWPVAAPFRYAEESISPISKAEISGKYKYINHGKDITADIKKSTIIELHEDGKITGTVQGNWEQINEFGANITIDGDTYSGVFVKQWDPTSKSFDLTFTVLSNKGIAIWGTETEEEIPQENHELPNEEKQANNTETNKSNEAKSSNSNSVFIMIGIILIVTLGIVLPLLRKRK